LAPEIVITGVGVISPIGIGVEAYRSAMQEQRSGIAPLTRFDASGLPMRFGGEISGFEPKQYIKPRKSLKMMSRDIQLSCAAAHMAIEDAAIEPETFDGTRFGVAFGSDLIYCELDELTDAYRKCAVEGEYRRELWGIHSMKELYPLWMLKYLPNMAACHVAIAHQAQGPNNSITLGEVSSLLALGEGFRIIERGAADVVLVGGGSSPINPVALLYRTSLPVSRRNDAPHSVPRPFDRERDGIVFGEGSAVFVLERRGHAESRGAKILARVLACSSGFEPPSREVTRSGSGIRRSIERALTAADLTAGEVGHVNAHGIGTTADDPVEAVAIRDLLRDVPVTAPKSFFGNLGAGTGAVEMVASLLALGDGEIPATANYEHPDPDCPINVVHKQPQRAAHPTALLLNQTSTGQAAAAILAAP